jgi:hypothetical protein
MTLTAILYPRVSHTLASTKARQLQLHSAMGPRVCLPEHRSLGLETVQAITVASRFFAPFYGSTAKRRSACVNVSGASSSCSIVHDPLARRDSGRESLICNAVRVVGRCNVRSTRRNYGATKSRRPMRRATRIARSRPRHSSATTRLRRTPIPEISTSQTSLGFMFRGEPSVPIQMTSPG